MLWMQDNLVFGGHKDIFRSEEDTCERLHVPALIEIIQVHHFSITAY